MTVKELKELLNRFQDDQNIILFDITRPDKGAADDIPFVFSRACCSNLQNEAVLYIKPETNKS